MTKKIYEVNVYDLEKGTIYTNEYQQEDFTEAKQHFERDVANIKYSFKGYFGSGAHNYKDVNVALYEWEEDEDGERNDDYKTLELFSYNEWKEEQEDEDNEE